MQEVPVAAAEGQAVGWILGIGLSRNLLSTEVVGVMPQESSFSVTSPFVSLAAKSLGYRLVWTVVLHLWCWGNTS